MRTRDNVSAVIKSLKRDQGLLAAYLEATDKIDWRALRETPKSVNVEAGQASSSPFVFGRANLVREPRNASRCRENLIKKSDG
jgi:hypothetical protein